MSDAPLRVLHLEDSLVDAELAHHELRKDALVFECRIVETRDAFLEGLREFRPDLILSDYKLPDFDGIAALKLAKELSPDVPFIITTGSLNEETAVACMKAGATDYVLKDSLGRLPIAVRGALETKRLAVERKTAESRILDLNRLLRTVNQVNELLVRATDEETLLREVCEILVSSGGYVLVWIGRPDPEARRVVPVASAGAAVEVLRAIEIRLDAAPEVRDPLAIAILERRTATVADVRDEPGIARYRDILTRQGISSIAALPITRGTVTSALAVYAAKVGFIDKEEVALLEELAGDLSFALDALDARDRVRKTDLELRKLWRAVEQTPATVVITDLEGRIEYVNPQFAESTGYSAGEVMGQNPRLLKSGLTPPEVYRALWETITSGRVWRGELCNRKKDGTLFWEEASISPVRDEHGATTSYVAVKEDITDRKRAAEKLAQSEAYYRSLIENGFDLTAVLSPDGCLRYTSSSIERILGYRAEELLGRSVFELMHEGDRKHTRERLRRAVVEGIHETTEARFRHKNGSWRTLSAIGNGLPAEAGVTGLVLSARDITDRLQLESEFRQAQKMEAVGRLAGGVAHDFNNLLTVIQGYGELLMSSLPGAGKERESVGEIVKAAERAAALTKQLLAFSRLQVLDMKVLDLGVIVAGTEKMLRRLISEDIEIVITKPGQTRRVKADEGQLVQVLVNLAVNARDAMPDGGRLTIAVIGTELDAPLPGTPDVIPPGRYASISVTDTGAGIDEKTLGHIFEPFFTTKEMGKGTGLGLATVYGIVRQSAGYMGVESVPGEGSTFRVYLPRCDSPASSGLRPAVRAASGNETILVVEDEPAVRNIARILLEGKGYAVVVAESGQAALDIAARDPRPIHVLLTDLVMPGMKGTDLAVRLRALRPAMKVVFMSGYAGAAGGDLGPGAESGFLGKPFDERTLAAKIREVLDAPAG